MNTLIFLYMILFFTIICNLSNEKLQERADLFLISPQYLLIYSGINSVIREFLLHQTDRLFARHAIFDQKTCRSGTNMFK